jgi:hypothetical protein
LAEVANAVAEIPKREAIEFLIGYPIHAVPQRRGPPIRNI